jgi:RimJ/RimL family protein N-acetyltransferase
MADATAIFHGYAQDPEVARYMPWRPHQSISETMEFLQSIVAAWGARDRYEWVVTQPPDDTALGMISLRPTDPISTVGYVLRRSVWGQGLMTEAARAVVDEALGRLGLYRVAAFCDVENLASARVLEKAGMVLEGRLRRFQLHPNLSPEPRDVLLYARTR